MATLTFIFSSLSSPTSSFPSSPATHNPKPSSLPLTASILHCNNPSQKFILEVDSQKHRKNKSRGSSVITYAGPTTASYIFAFAFPLSLIIITVITTIKIDNELDRKFLEEVALNQEILDAEEEGTDRIDLEEKPEVPRKRNRPKRSRSIFHVAKFLEF